jgi:hypothetical protein
VTGGQTGGILADNAGVDAACRGISKKRWDACHTLITVDQFSLGSGLIDKAVQVGGGQSVATSALVLLTECRCAIAGGN